MQFDVAYGKGDHYMFKVWYKASRGSVGPIRGFYTEDVESAIERLDADDKVSHYQIMKIQKMRTGKKNAEARNT